ncbi:hypothetical protein Vi05172_g183 [Venturia inaequalis]|nr:hypothetical protein Vi05172_g183 [Venturia inaequalis]
MPGCDKNDHNFGSPDPATEEISRALQNAGLACRCIPIPASGHATNVELLFSAAIELHW